MRHSRRGRAPLGEFGEVEKYVRGKVFASCDVLWAAARIASIGLGGVLADTTGITSVSYLGGSLLLAAGASGLIRCRHEDIAVEPRSKLAGT